MKKRIDEILDICLDRIIDKGDSIEECLVAYPEYSEELEGLLKASLSVSKASDVIKARSEFERIAKHRLFSALQTNRAKKPGNEIPLWRWQRRMATVFAVLLVMFLIGAGTVTASADSLPGDALYPVKNATEKIQGFFTFGDGAKANFHMKLAEKRLDEVDMLAKNNRAIPQWLLDLMNNETEHAIELIVLYKPEGKDMVTRLTILTSNQKTILTEVLEKVPAQFKGRLGEALKRSERAQRRAALLEEILPQLDKSKEIKPFKWHEESWIIDDKTSGSLLLGNDRDSFNGFIVREPG